MTTYRGLVRLPFSAVHTLPGRESGRLHGHDYTATFLFEARDLAHPGVVVDDGVHGTITRYIRERLDHRDLDQLLDGPSTCEAIADHLATWYATSARGPQECRLVSVTVTTAAGAHGEVRRDPERG